MNYQERIARVTEASDTIVGVLGRIADGQPVQEAEVRNAYRLVNHHLLCYSVLMHVLDKEQPVAAPRRTTKRQAVPHLRLVIGGRCQKRLTVIR